MNWVKKIQLPLGFVLFSVAVSRADDRPNILFAFADDWGRYASVYREIDGPGTLNDFIDTPNFDNVAKSGVVFNNAHVNAPSCTPCRSSLLSGQYFFRTGRAAFLQGAIWDDAIPSYPLLLEEDGYDIGFTAKVWSPGTPRDAPYGAARNAFSAKPQQFNAFSQTATRSIEIHNLSVQEAKAVLIAQAEQAFEKFLRSRQAGKPFCYWFGPTNVHRKWIAGSGKRLWGIDPDRLKGHMPPFLPDVPTVREDMADYLGEAMAFDAMLGVILKKLEATGERENTIIVVSGDHGAPGFPRGKCNLYDFGTRVPLAISWGRKIAPNRVVDDFVNLMDLAPTFLEAAGTKIPEVMTGKSLLPVLEAKDSGQIDPQRNQVVTGRERHVEEARADRKPYPQRAIRSKEYLYIINFEPDRWPMGDPYNVSDSQIPDRYTLTNDTFVTFGDLDASPTKAFMLENRNHQAFRKMFQLGFAKRPAEELYVMAEDPHQINNVAGDDKYTEIKAELRARLLDVLRDADDPRVTQEKVPFEHPPFVETGKD
ncbi:MAG: sulfatase [Verrucomicrobiales bacterium]|nr:sulfatase [Verrucomicrobiales bacterium]